MTVRGVLRRAVPSAVAAGAVVVVLANVRPRLPLIAAGAGARPAPAPASRPDVRRVSARPASRPGRTITATGMAIATPFAVVQVAVTLTGRELTRVETVALSGENAHTQALNDHAEPILRREALRAGSAKIDVVTGATYTSESYLQSLQSALDRARAALRHRR